MTRIVILKNTTITDKTYVGAFIPAATGSPLVAGQNTISSIPPHILYEETVLLTDVTSGDIVVNDGTVDLNPEEGRSYILHAFDSDGPVFFRGSSAVSFPPGTTAERPAFPTEGMVRYNEDILENERYVNGSWERGVRENDLAEAQNGFENRVDSTLSFVDGTRTFTIEPAVSSYMYYSQNLEWNKTVANSIQIPDIEGIHHFYFVGDTLTTTQTFSDTVITDYAYIANVYWDATNSKIILFGEERHGRIMDSATHVWAHNSFGTRYNSGLGLANMDVDGNGDNTSAAQLSVGNGIIRDEDIKLTIADGLPQELDPIAQIPIFYRDGAAGVWRMVDATTFPMTTTGTGRLAWNEYTGLIWQISEVTDKDFALVHYFATNDLTHSIVGVVGQNEYGDVGDARTGAASELHALALGALGVLAAEFKAIASVIVETQNGYSNAVKSRIRSTDEGDDFIDWRETDFGSGGGTAASDHGNLSGLNDDDHLQYTLNSYDTITDGTATATATGRGNTIRFVSGLGISVDVEEAGGSPPVSSIDNVRITNTSVEPITFDSNLPGVVSGRSVLQNITNGSYGTMNWDITHYEKDPNAVSHNPVTNNTRLTFGDTGTFLVFYSLTLDPSTSTTQFDVRVIKNGVLVAIAGSARQMFEDDEANDCSNVFLLDVVAGDYVELQTQANQTGANMLATSNFGAVRMGVAYGNLNDIYDVSYTGSPAPVDGDILIYQDGSPPGWTNGTISDELTKVSANDTTAGYLNGKLVIGTHTTLTENNDGANETLTVDVDPSTINVGDLGDVVLGSPVSSDDLLSWNGSSWINTPTIFGDSSVVQARRTTILSIPQTFLTVTYDTTDVETDANVVEHNPIADTSRITAKEDGLYLVGYNLNSVSYSADSSTETHIEARVLLNGSVIGSPVGGIPGSEIHDGNYYSLTGNISEDTFVSNQFLIDLSANDYLEVQVAAQPLRSVTGFTAILNSEGHSSIFWAIKQQTLRGEQGVPGSGSNINVKEEGTLITNSPFSVLNFGSGFSAVDGGSGEVDITADFVFGKVPLVTTRRTTQFSFTQTSVAIPFDTTDIENDITIIEQTDASTFVVKKTGEYLLHLNLFFTVSHVDKTISIEITRNGTAIPETQTDIVVTDTAAIKAVTPARIVLLTAFDVIQVKVVVDANTGYVESGSTFGIGGYFSIKGDSGTDGADGADGAPGSGSSIIVKDNGVNVTNTPHNALNFIGSGVTVIDGGGSPSEVVDITILGTIKQIVHKNVTVAVSTTTTIPMNATPTSTSGVAFDSHAITMTGANTVRFQMVIPCDSDNDVAVGVAVVSRSTTVLAVGVRNLAKKELAGNSIVLDFYDTPGTGTHTYTVRLGTTANTAYFNQAVVDATPWGGTLYTNNCNITLTEI